MSVSGTENRQNFLRGGLTPRTPQALIHKCFELFVNPTATSNLGSSFGLDPPPLEVGTQAWGGLDPPPGGCHLSLGGLDPPP
jgi:hypothetical protein